MKYLILSIFTLISVGISSQNIFIRENFKQPDIEYAPWTWWHWMNGNVSKEGITLDLEAMRRVGIGGLVCFNGSAGIPQGHLKYGTKEWYEYNRHAMKEAQRLGMKMMLHNAPGYSVTGGPWITPENSMQQVVWTEVFVNENSQNIKLTRPYAKMGYYEDIAVIAYPALKGEEISMQAQLEKTTLNGKVIDCNKLFDFDYESYINVEVSPSRKQGELLFEFEKPYEASSIVIRREHTAPPHHPYDGPRDNPPTYELQYSDDGITFKEVCKISMPQLRELNVPTSQNFMTVKAKYFKLLTNKDSKITELTLYTSPRLDSWESKANYTTKGNRTANFTEKQISSNYIIKPESIVDITSYMNPDGTLNWSVPEGNWTILRIGHTTTGEENAAAPNGAIGLECDKLGKRGIKSHYDNFLKKLFEETKEFRGNSFQGLIVDSWEAGTQNWTKGFDKEFNKRQQYKLIPFIAAFTGRIVGGASSTEKFLADVRQLQATMLAENYYQELRNYCHQNNLILLSEPYGDGPFYSLEVAKYLDIPAGEFWAHALYGGTHTNNQAGYIARTNGKQIAAAEAYTAMPDLSKFTEYPAAMKGEGDWMFCNGINRFMFHTYAHQPNIYSKPGMTMGPFGTHMNRNQTWWEQSKFYMDYLRRCQFMLQQGRFISNSSPWIPTGEDIDPTQKKDDFSFFSLENNSIINYIHRKVDNIDYYFVANNKRSSEKILAFFDINGKQPQIWYPETGKQLPIFNYKIENGKTIIPLNLNSAESVFVVFEGNPTQSLIWNENDDLRNIKVKSQSFNDIQNSFTVSVWLRPDVSAVGGRSYVLYPQNGETLYGKNHATIGLTVGQNGIKLFEQVKDRSEQVLFAETKIEGWSLVNVVYNNGKPIIYLNGKKIKEGTKSKYTVHPNNVELAQKEAMITVFQGEYRCLEIQANSLSDANISDIYKKGIKDATSYYIDNKKISIDNIINFNNEWQIVLSGKSESKKEFSTKSLKSLHLYTDKDIKYFSGTANYTSHINITKEQLAQDKRLILDLGNVAFFAEVFINGVQIPTLWKAPYISDVTQLVKEGKNEIRINVTNLWTNRLIGDELLPEENKYDKWGEIEKLPDWYIKNQPYTGKRNTFVTWKQYDKEGPLTEAGLIGPVKILITDSSN